MCVALKGQKSKVVKFASPSKLFIIFARTSYRRNAHSSSTRKTRQPKPALIIMTGHRIVSLLPSTTEIIFALGAGDQVVGVTHECDFPPEAMEKKHCTRNLLLPDLNSAEIDEAVCKSLASDAHTIYLLDTEIVRNLQPTVIVTQSLCPVCAVPEKAVRDFTCSLPYSCPVVACDPHTLDELFGAICHIGKAIKMADPAEKLVIGLKERLNKVRAGVSSLPRRRVLILEWPEPPYAPGHWVPDMIEAAGGICVLGEKGQKSRRVTWESLCNLNMDIVISAFCGYDLAQNERECDKLETSANWIKLTSKVKVFSSNASAYFSRPGNRLLDGTEILAFIIHGLPQFKPPPRCASLHTTHGWVDLADV